MERIVMLPWPGDLFWRDNLDQLGACENTVEEAKRIE